MVFGKELREIGAPYLIARIDLALLGCQVSKIVEGREDILTSDRNANRSYEIRETGVGDDQHNWNNKWY